MFWFPAGVAIAIGELHHGILGALAIATLPALCTAPLLALVEWLRRRREAEARPKSRRKQRF